MNTNTFYVNGGIDKPIVVDKNVWEELTYGQGFDIQYLENSDNTFTPNTAKQVRLGYLFNKSNIVIEKQFFECGFQSNEFLSGGGLCTIIMLVQGREYYLKNYNNNYLIFDVEYKAGKDTGELKKVGAYIYNDIIIPHPFTKLYLYADGIVDRNYEGLGDSVTIFPTEIKYRQL